MTRTKVAVIGAGNVGATAAQRIAERELGDVTLIDIVEGLPQGKALDLWESGPVMGHDSRLTGSNDFAAMQGSDVVVVTAGLARKPGMTRSDLLGKNAEIVRGIAESIRKHAPDAVVVTVTNPLDPMTWLTWKVTGFPHQRVVGMAGILDSARFRTFIADELKVSVREVEAMVLGGHGDTMVPLVRYATVNGVPIPDLLPAATVERLVQRTRDGGAEVVALLKTGSAYYAPAASVLVMVESILRDQKRLVPCCALVQGAYGLSDVYLGVPVVLGRGGVERVVELKLSADELKALKGSADRVVADIRELKV